MRTVTGFLIYVFVSLQCSDGTRAPSAIPRYLQTGISKFLTDAEEQQIPQAEMMIALVSTGHVGKNIHNHRMRLMQAVVSGERTAVHNAKREAIVPLGEVFQAVEDAHKKILAQIQNPFPSEQILDGLAQAMLLMKANVAVLRQLSTLPNPIVASFYQEMADVLERALGLKEYLKAVLPLLFDDESIAAVVVVSPQQAETNTRIVTSITEGYSKLIRIGASDEVFATAFTRVEFDRVWEN